MVFLAEKSEHRNAIPSANLYLQDDRGATILHPFIFAITLSNRILFG